MALLLKQKKQHNFSAEHDADALNKAIKGIGTDDKVLVDIISTRPRHHLLRVKEIYHQKFKHTLEQDIKGDTSGHYEDILLALITERNQYLATLLHRAVAGLGTSEHVITEILCTHSNARLQKVAHAYTELFKKNLVTDILQDLSGDVKNLYTEVLKFNRPEDPNVNHEKAKEDAAFLFKAGEGKLGTDENAFIKIITTRSREHMAVVNRAYADAHGHSLIQAIEKETSHHFKNSLVTLVTPLDQFFAEKVRHSIKGAGTDEATLIRVFGGVTKRQLKAADNFYLQRHNTTFKNDIKSDVSGNFGKVLLAIVPDTL